MSAEEDPLEAPLFEFPLQDTVASSGAEVLLKCIISGNPLPEGKLLKTKCITKKNCITKTVPVMEYKQAYVYAFLISSDMDSKQCGNKEQSHICGESGGREALSSHQMVKTE